MLDLTVKHNGKSYNVQLEGSCTLGHLFDRLKEETGVPVSAQKLIYNGKQLSRDLNAPLAESGVCSGGKIMLLGKRYDPTQDAAFKDVLNYEIKALLIETKFMKVQDEYEGIAAGHLCKGLVAEALATLEKRTKGHSEELLKILESLDSVSVSEDQVEVRQKRKTVAGRVNQMMDANDRLLIKIQDLRSR